MSSSLSEVGSVTSFRKKGSSVPRIRGTRVSVQNAQLLTSTGVSTLDLHLGGGLAVGSVILIEEDRFRTHSNILLKYFVAEGVTNAHSVLLVSGDVAPEKILKELPAVVTVEAKSQPALTDDQLKIAWRYKEKRTTLETSSFSHNYDLTKTLSREEVEKSSITTWDPSVHSYCDSEKNHFVEEPFFSLLQQIKSQLEKGHFQTSDKSTCSNLLRIAISSLGSPLWSSGDKKLTEATIPKFLYALRMLLRSSFAVAFVTVPPSAIEDKKLIGRIRQMSDSVISLESFVGSEKRQNPLFKDFDGLLQIVKLPLLNTFMYQVPTSDLAFKLKRKNFFIERLHLPPDIEDPTPGDPGSFSCGSRPGPLDF